MPRILVVDDDPWIQKMVSTILVKRGHLVETAGDGEEALRKASGAPPDLIITDIMMPRMDGWAFVRAVRSRGDLALIPVVFLTALAGDNDRLRGFRLGADEYLPKPFRFEDLATRVTAALEKRKKISAEVNRPSGARAAGEGTEEAAPDGATVLHGALSHIGLSTLLVVLEMEQKTGVLVLQRRGDLGRMFLRRGSIIRASLERHPDSDGRPLENAPAIYEMLRWGEGRFDFANAAVEGDDVIAASTTYLLMEGARLIDEMANAAKAGKAN